VTNRRARIYDLLALLTAIIVVILDQWTKALVVENLSPPDFGPKVSLVGQYLILYYIRNNGAAFSMLSNNAVLIVLILIAVAVIVYLYVRILNTGTPFTKTVFGLIIGGAAGNLIDRARHSGYVIDFVSFRIPQINFYFGIFNLADAAISVGVFLLFILVLVNSLRHQKTSSSSGNQEESGGSSKVGDKPSRSTPLS
jgi:signal peptidase II